MTLSDDIKWFKQTFGAQTLDALNGTPFTLDLISAIATQESYEVWGRARKANKTVDDIFYLCVGDIIDASGGRSAFPHSRASLEAVPNGKEMFQVARKAIEDMATVATEYQKYLRNPDKFAHAFGIFQYDMQVFQQDQDFFLQKQWADYGKCLTKCLAELQQKRVHVFGAAKTTFSDSDLVYVAIAYNKGSAHVGAGFKQGFRGDDGRYYGEMIWEYMQIAKAAGVP